MWLRSIAFVLLASLFAVASAAEGSWSTSGPHGGNTSQILVYPPNPNFVWVHGSGGLFRSTNGGNNWSRAEVGFPPISGVTSASVSTVGPSPVLYAGTYLNLIYRSGDGGATWVPTAFPTIVNDYLNGLAMRQGSINSVLAFTRSSAYISSNGGATWTAPAILNPDTVIYSGLFASDGSAYLGIENSTAYPNVAVLKSSDGGLSWMPTAMQPVTANLGRALVMTVSKSDSQRLYISDSFFLNTSSNGGANWIALAKPTDCNITGLFAASSSSDVFVSCRNQGLFYSADATLASPVWVSRGNSSNQLTANGTDTAQLSFVSAHPNYPSTPTIWAATEYGGIFKSTTNGSNWLKTNTGFESTNIRALASHPLDGSVLLAGHGDSFTTSVAIWRSLDQGVTWSEAITGLNAEHIRAISIDPTTVDNDPFTSENFVAYAVGRSERIPATANKDGGIYKSTDGGQSWATIDNGIALVGGRPDMGTVRSITPDPRSCATPVPSPPAPHPCPAGSGGLQTIYVGGSGQPNFTGPGLPNHAARLYKSVNAGATWTASESGLPLPKEEGALGENLLSYMGGVVPMVIDPSNSNTLYIGTFYGTYYDISTGPLATIDNGVFKSTDAGATWALSSTGLPRVGGAGTSHPSVLALAISPSNPLLLYAATINFATTPQTGEVFKTTNGGGTWVSASAGLAGADVRALFMDPNDLSGDTLYAATAGTGSNPGGVYKTTDGGLTWNSFSIGMEADSATSLDILKRATGTPATILSGTRAGVWRFTEPVDPDGDGAPSPAEAAILGTGDGNNDGTQDATQRHVASLGLPSFREGGNVVNGNTSANVVVAVVGTTCTQLNNVTRVDSALYPPDPQTSGNGQQALGMLRFELPLCASVQVDVKYPGQNFSSSSWTWRNYGPQIPGDDRTFAWYTFAGAAKLSADTWRLTLNANQLGSYRSEPDAILFVGGAANDNLFSNGFE